ncbi:Steroidogenic acute regulatory-like protein [Blattella germanica]|nr:Steroidogenic acute regulatory-like protein [Blattella germanica]
MKPIPGDPNRCVFQWLLNTRLNGWLPQYVVDAALATTMFDYLTHIRKYSQKLRDQGLMDT